MSFYAGKHALATTLVTTKDNVFLQEKIELRNFHDESPKHVLIREATGYIACLLNSAALSPVEARQIGDLLCGMADRALEYGKAKR